MHFASLRLPVLFIPGILLAVTAAPPLSAQRTAKPVLHGTQWVAITGKPMAATAGALTFAKGGNAVDATCAMLAAVCTMWDSLSWGGETQALIYNPHTGKVVAVNALGMAPSGATVEFFQKRKPPFPPEYGPLAAVTPGTPGGLMVMLAEFGTLSLADVLAPAIKMADGYPIEQQAVDAIEKNRAEIMKWPESKRTFLTGSDGDPLRPSAPEPGEIFRQPDLAATLRKLVATEAEARKAGKDRKAAIMAAYERFYRGDIAEEIVRGCREVGGLFTTADLRKWKVKLEEPVSTNYKGIDVYKLTHWSQGPALLQALNLVELAEVRDMGYNSARYIHTLYQVMNLAFADRDFYYGDPDFPPEEPIRGLLSKDYARSRFATINWQRNNPRARPGDPYPFQGDENPFKDLLKNWRPMLPEKPTPLRSELLGATMTHDEAFHAGTTSIQAADASGWVVSVTPSGGWVPAVIAGKTGIGLSQRMQSFVMDRTMNPFNVLEPGKRPRVTLTPSLALKDGKPFMAFSVQGGDSQDQNLLQFFLNVVEFGMNVQQAAEAANIESFQMHSSFGEHKSEPGRIVVRSDVPVWVRAELVRMGYRVDRMMRTSGPITAILIDPERGTFQGAASDHGEDYGIAW